MFLAVSLLAAAGTLCISNANAEQYASGRNVVHTRRLPVVAHRIVPPFRGVHVYAGRRR
jgi:hypothetical protein